MYCSKGAMYLMQKIAKIGGNKNANSLKFQLSENIRSHATFQMLLYHITKGVAVNPFSPEYLTATFPD